MSESTNPEKKAAAKLAASIAIFYGPARVILDQSLIGSTGTIAENFNVLGVFEEIEGMLQKLDDGDDIGLQKMLLSQALATQQIFTALAHRAAMNKENRHHNELMTLALKAQSASRATIAALGELRNPKTTVFAKQVNAAAGHQQVNNGAAPSAQAPKAVAPEKPAAIEVSEASPIGIVGTVGVRATRTREKTAAAYKRTIGGKK